MSYTGHSKFIDTFDKFCFGKLFKFSHNGHSTFCPISTLMFAHSSDTVKKSNSEKHAKIINVCVKGL